MNHKRLVLSLFLFVWNWKSRGSCAYNVHIVQQWRRNAASLSCFLPNAEKLCKIIFNYLIFTIDFSGIFLSILHFHYGHICKKVVSYIVPKFLQLDNIILAYSIEIDRAMFLGQIQLTLRRIPIIGRILQQSAKHLTVVTILIQKSLFFFKNM